MATEENHELKQHLNGIEKSLDTEKIQLMIQLVEMHKSQLVSSGIPERYWPVLFEKLSNEVLDPILFQFHLKKK